VASVGLPEACAALRNCFDWLAGLAQEGGVPPKAILLQGLDRLLVGRADASSGAAVGQAVAALAGCPLPVIAVLTGDNRPAAVLAAAACDLAICSAEGSYDLRAPGFPTAARRLLAERFGRAATGATAL